MSVIVGLRKEHGATVTAEEFAVLASRTSRYAPDGTYTATRGRIAMAFQAYHCHSRSHLEATPFIDAFGNIFSLDGRLDNHEHLRKLLGLSNPNTPDSTILASAFVRWGVECCAHLSGDWALAIWSEHDQTLYLSRDHAGTRSLYFHTDGGTVSWSTYLETFFAPGAQHPLDREYAAAFLGLQPIRDLTPYAAIRSVPPAHYLAIRETRILKVAHWTARPHTAIRYSSNRQYDEHFLHLFAQAVARRDAPGDPVLAQLSGGMDSSAIVCMSDYNRRRLNPEAGLIDTVSFYDDSEPNWNERPYFMAVEKQRGKEGVHIPTSVLDRTLDPPEAADARYLFPGYDSSSLRQEQRFEQLIAGERYRAVLSGIGGDEVLGGVPTPLPELADYMASGRFVQLFRRSVAWCLVDRSPLVRSLLDTLRFAGQTYYRQAGKEAATYLHSWKGDALHRTRQRAHFPWWTLPSTLSNQATWWAVMETLPHLRPCINIRREYRYPYLDKDLVEFLSAIPREQLVQPGRRRAMMRRALRDIIPSQVLERRRKAFLSRGPLLLIQREQQKIKDLFAISIGVEAGLLDRSSIERALMLVTTKSDLRSSAMIHRAIGLELWLRAMPLTGADAAPHKSIFKDLPSLQRASKFHVRNGFY